MGWPWEEKSIWDPTNPSGVLQILIGLPTPAPEPFFADCGAHAGSPLLLIAGICLFPVLLMLGKEAGFEESNDLPSSSSSLMKGVMECLRFLHWALFLPMLLVSGYCALILSCMAFVAIPYVLSFVIGCICIAVPCAIIAVGAHLFLKELDR
jgi:hypothetical protein